MSPEPSAGPPLAMSELKKIWPYFKNDVDRGQAVEKITYDIFRTFDLSLMLGRLVQAGGVRPVRRGRWSQPWKRELGQPVN